MDYETLGGGQITYRYIFMKWKEAERPAKVPTVLHVVLEYYDIDATNVSNVEHEIKDYISNVCKYFKKLWVKHNRNVGNVLKYNSGYLDAEFCLPEEILCKLPSTSENNNNRKLKSFNDSSDSTKRRRTEQLRMSYSADELVYATQMSLRSSGNNTAAGFLKKTAQSSTPNSSVCPFKTLSSTATPFTGSEALAFVIDENLTKSQYVNTRKILKLRNINVYPSYNKVLHEKQKCYPASIKVTETLIDVPLQELLNHTCLRILQATIENFKHFSEDDLLQLNLVVKWGFDGSSGHSEYKQRFNETEEASDSHMFLTSIVPIRVVANGKTLFQNPAPSSTRYCRPLRIQLIKETTEVSVAEKKIVEEQIANLQPFETVVDDRNVRVEFRMILTMIDGKICNAITLTASAQRCYLCGAKPKEMNDIDAVKRRLTDASALNFGLSSLHAWIRFMEYFLHVSYRLNIRKWQARGSDLALVKERKTDIQRKFKIEMGLNIDKPRSSGCGTSNDGNTARRFFRDAEKSSEITGIDFNVLQRCAAILQVIASGKSINTYKFEEYCLETAHRLITLYPWYYLPASVHKILIHGAEIIKNFVIPIGQLSEEAQESLNKVIRYTREHHSRKISRIATNRDVFHRLLEYSDPYISSKRSLSRKPEVELLPDAQALLEYDEIDTVNNAEISESSDSE